MISIRKFVGCFGGRGRYRERARARLSTPTASAGTVESVDAAPVAHDTHTALQALSPACVTAIQAIKTAFANDRRKTPPSVRRHCSSRIRPRTRRRTLAEVDRFKALFAAAHTACAASIAAVTKTHTWTSDAKPAVHRGGASLESSRQSVVGATHEADGGAAGTAAHAGCERTRGVRLDVVLLVELEALNS